MNQKVTIALPLVVAAALLLAGCGAGHPTLTGIAVTPSTATASFSTRGAVGYPATGTFSDPSRRQLTQAAGLTWSTSNRLVAGISDSGSATCVRGGVVTVTASAPANLTITVTNTVTNTSPKVSSTASLTCM